MVKSERFDVAEHLKSPDDIRLFLKEVMITGNESDFLHAVKTAARAVEMMEEIEKGHLGVSLEDFLKEQDMYEDATKYAAESRMKNPAHPGAIIKDSLEELGLSVAEGAKALGVSRSQLHKVVSETSAVTPEMAMRLEIVIGSKAEMWLRLQNSYDLAQVREKVSGLGLKKVRAEHPHL